jgi:hypothetical protein
MATQAKPDQLAANLFLRLSRLVGSRPVPGSPARLSRLPLNFDPDE